MLLYCLLSFLSQFTIINYTCGFCAMDSLPTSTMLCLQYSFLSAAVTNVFTFVYFICSGVIFFNFTNVITFRNIFIFICISFIILYSFHSYVIWKTLAMDPCLYSLLAGLSGIMIRIYYVKVHNKELCNFRTEVINVS
jgi:hypothetical protein